MTEIMKGLEVSIRPGKTLLCFRSSKGTCCMFNVEEDFPAIHSKAVTEWIQDTLNQEDLMLNLIKKLTP